MMQKSTDSRYSPIWKMKPGQNLTTLPHALSNWYSRYSIAALQRDRGAEDGR